MKSPLYLRGLAVLFVFSVLALPLCAQSARGTINGAVKDATGAVVPGAEVVIVNKDTGVETKTLTTDSGVYRAPYLTPGKYKISVSLPGFKTAVADNVDLGVAQVLDVDLTLEVGEVSDTVTVSSETPLLEKGTSEIGINTTEKEVHTWPIQVGDGTRQLQTFIFNSLPGTQGNEFAGTINGGQSYSHEILIDGISIGRFDLNGGSNNEFTPTMDAVSEFKLQTGALSSQYGNTQTALANFGLKSGTNDFHGSVFWFHQNSALNTQSWAGNRRATAAQRKKAPNKLNNFGAVFGGPIIRDRTHFFFSYEGNRQANYTISGTNTIPNSEFRKGNFARLLNPAFTTNPRSGTVIGTDALGRPVVFGQIYDPFSSRLLPDGTWIRDPFPGNVIPENRFSQVTRNVLRHDIPNPIFDQLFRFNNPRVGGCCPELIIDNFSIKLDHVLNQSHKMVGSYTLNDRYRRRYGGGGTPQLGGVQIPGPAAAGDKTQTTPGGLIRFAEDWTVSPTMLNHFAFGYNRFRNANVSNSFLSGVNWTKELGLRGVGSNTFPQISFSGLNTTLSPGYARLGHGGTGDAPNGSAIVSNDFSWIVGSHNLKIGGEHRRYFLNERSVQNWGSYAFHNENTGLPGFTISTGFSYASFLLGTARSAGLGIPLLTPGIRSRTTAFYVQDDWKATPTLTLNLGLRWDIPEPFREVANRMSGLNPTKPNPGADGFPGAFEMLGDCKGCSGRTTFTDTYWGEIGPRIGLAWAPNSKLVIRGGYGINYHPPLQDGFDFPYFEGFNGSNPINPRTGRFREDPSYLWDTPYKPFTAILPNSDPTLLNGGDIGYYLPQTKKLPRVQNWNFGVQMELPWRTRLEANYIGNDAIRLKDNYLYSLNQVNPKFLSLGDKLLDDIADHPEIKKPYPSFQGTVAQALRPFPQYQSVTTHRLNDGYSSYNSLQMTFTRRTENLSFLAAYTFSKALSNADSAIGYGGGYGQDFYNRKGDYSVSSFNVPHDVKLTWIYQLPFGPGQRWAQGGLWGKVAGGWTFSAIQRYSSGGPLSIGGGSFDDQALFNPGLYADVKLPRDKQIIGEKPNNPDPNNGTPYLNPAAFGPPPLTGNGVPIRLGNAGRFLPNLRGFAQWDENLSVIKKTALGFREGAFFELRIDVANPMNRTGIVDPQTDASDPASFGRVYGKYGGRRTIQGGARFTF
ncbi:MAG: TonB-dependent receptor domain-containing protein [Acidobacteriota bacterium]